MTASFNLDDYPYLEEPEYFNTFLTYVRHVVNRYKDEPTLIAWCIWNEPRLELPTELKEQTLKEYRSFLFRKYDGDIKKLNRLYFHQYQSFDEILPPKKFNVSDMPEKYNMVTKWRRFLLSTCAPRKRHENTGPFELCQKRKNCNADEL